MKDHKLDLPLKPRRPPTTEEILHRARRATYHVDAIADCKIDGKHPDKRTRAEWLAVSARQKQLRAELGIPEPNPDQAELRTKWAG